MDTDKQRLYDAFNRGEDYYDLARHLGIKRTTAWAIVKRADENNGQVSRPRGGARRASTKVTEDMRQVTVDIVEQHPEFTLDQINEELQRRYPQGAPISRTTLANVLSRELIVLKKLEDAPTDQVKELPLLTHSK